MDDVKEIEIRVSSELVGHLESWGLKKLGFKYPVLHAYNARMESQQSDGTYYYTNVYMSEASRPTYGLAVHFLKEQYNVHFQIYHKRDVVEKHEKWKNDFLKVLKDLEPLKEKKEKRINYNDAVQCLEYEKEEILLEVKKVDEALKTLKKYRKK